MIKHSHIINHTEHMMIMMQLHDKQKISDICLRDSIGVDDIIKNGYLLYNADYAQIMLQLSDKLLITDEELYNFFETTEEDRKQQ